MTFQRVKDPDTPGYDPEVLASSTVDYREKEAVVNVIAVLAPIAPSEADFE